MTSGGRHPGRLEILAARAQLALNRRTNTPSPDWLVTLGATDTARAGEAAPAAEQPPQVRPTLLPSVSRPRRALALLPERPMQGRDVLDLQRALVVLGYGEDSLIMRGSES